MQVQKKGVLFVISGPSGVGKGTLNSRLFDEFGDQLAFSVSATTRAPREHEIDGKHYFFISRQEFVRHVANNDFLEHAEYSGNCYGTLRPYVGGLLEQGKNVLLEIEVNGAMQVMERMPECVSVFILPPSMEELEHRLRGRGTEDEDKVRQRLSAARWEIDHAPLYRYRIVNGGDVEEAYRALRDIYLRETHQA